MQSRSRCAGAGAIIAGLGGWVAIAGCSNVFGFEHASNLVDCVYNSDCPGTWICRTNRCMAQCIRDRDCTSAGYVCIDGACSVPADAGVGAPQDGSTDVATCPSCGDGGEGCVTAWYTPRGQVPQPGPTANFYSMPSSTIIGQQIFVAHAGCLVRLGMFVSRWQDYGRSSPTTYELGLYSETGGGGYPSQLVWRSPPSTIQSGSEQNEVEVSPPVPLGSGTFYWVVSTSSNAVEFETYGIDGDWVSSDLSAFDAPWGQTFPPPSQNPPAFLRFPQAIEYAVVTSK